MLQNKSVEEIKTDIRKTLELYLGKDEPTLDYVDARVDELLQTSQEREREIIEEVLPYLKGYLNTLDTDWSINPVQAVNAVYIPPEQVLRNSANEIEAKRERAKQLRQLIENFTNLNKD